MLTTDIARQVSGAWKSLPSHEREAYEEMARQDRARYEREKAAYKGPWKVPSSKNPTAPKRPASAFLAFSNERRRDVSQDNPDLSSAEISGLLSKMWKEAPTPVRDKFREEERQRREQYKKDLSEWSEKQTSENDMGQSKSSSLPQATPSSSATFAATLAAAASATSAAAPSSPDVARAQPQSPQDITAGQGQPMNASYANLLPFLYQSLTGTTIQQQPQPQIQQPTQYQLLLGAFHGQLQNLAASTMSGPSETTATDFSSYATFASSSAQASSSQHNGNNNLNQLSSNDVASFYLAAAVAGLFGRDQQQAALQQALQQGQPNTATEDSKPAAVSYPTGVPLPSAPPQPPQQQQQEQQAAVTLQDIIAALQAVASRPEESNRADWAPG